MVWNKASLVLCREIRPPIRWHVCMWSRWWSDWTAACADIESNVFFSKVVKKRVWNPRPRQRKKQHRRLHHLWRSGSWLPLQHLRNWKSGGKGGNSKFAFHCRKRDDEEHPVYASSSNVIKFNVNNVLCKNEADSMVMIKFQSYFS